MNLNSSAEASQLVGFDADALCRLKSCPFSLSNWSETKETGKMKSELKANNNNKAVVRCDLGLGVNSEMKIKQKCKGKRRDELAEASSNSYRETKRSLWKYERLSTTQCWMNSLLFSSLCQCAYKTDKTDVFRSPRLFFTLSRSIRLVAYLMLPFWKVVLNMWESERLSLIKFFQLSIENRLLVGRVLAITYINRCLEMES